MAFLTGHEDPAKPETALDWPAIAAFPGTLVFYMGVRQLPALVDRLQAGGRPAGQPAALVERGTVPEQRVAVGTLGTIAALARARGIRAPAVSIFGEVAALHEQLDWFGRGPLAGRSIAVTRARAQASGLAARLRELGASVIETPAIRIVPLGSEVPDLEPYDLICLTSPNGVHELFARLHVSGRDARALPRATVAAIGPGTARALREHGVVADVVPERFVAEGLIEALDGVPVRRALIARAAQARDVLPDALRERGAEVDVLPLYETMAEALDAGELRALRAADYVTFTSSSTVRYLLEAAPEGLGPETRIVSIGPVTSGTLRELGLEPQVEAVRHDIDGLIEAIVADAGGADGDV